MTVTIETHVPAKLREFLGSVRPEGLAALNEHAARALEVALKRHILSYAPSKHGSARRLGASPTRHIEKRIDRISHTSDRDGATFTIPIPGFSRAFKDVEVRPGPGRTALTLPMAAVAYGRTVAEVRALGWTVFRPKGGDVLMGAAPGSEEVQTLYLLRGRVTLRKDPSLLPSADEMGGTFARAIVERCLQAARKAGLRAS